MGSFSYSIAYFLGVLMSFCEDTQQGLMNQEQHDGGVYYFETETPGQCCGFMNT